MYWTYWKVYIETCTTEYWYIDISLTVWKKSVQTSEGSFCRSWQLKYQDQHIISHVLFVCIYIFFGFRWTCSFLSLCGIFVLDNLFFLSFLSDWYFLTWFCGGHRPLWMWSFTISPSSLISLLLDRAYTENERALGW